MLNTYHAKSKTMVLESDFEAVRQLLPHHYTVTESKEAGNIHCVSRIGILKDGDAEDDEHWGYVMSGLRKHFGARFSEVFHNVCFGHKNFTIYIKQFSDSALYKGILSRTIS